MADFILVTIIIAIFAVVVLYLLRAKKRGEHCVGCPYSKQCGGKQCRGKNNN